MKPLTLAELRALVERFVACPDDPDAHLELASLDVVDISTALEERCSIIISAGDVVRDNFATLNALHAMLCRKFDTRHPA